ncbi:Orn/Lys/Arg decarboxylase, major domain [Pseudonocardia oroxyli]|uniref:Orn/Lys/Arg decarboxylase, major domain n=1 Tax=Pseudonocardia oroxyli TaxID=366584 RepID=A0A1G7PVS3_PSEOR|nr:Orn/Lys/Arg decarboxylase, major domain [Pseudonocardia oroxyli]
MIARAQELMADAVGAEHAFFSTCGSWLSVKSAMLAVAGRHGRILVGRDAHKSVVSGLVLSGLQPVWVHPRYDREHHLAHPPAPEDVRAALDRDDDVARVLITSPTPYGTCADLSVVAEICHARGLPLLPFHERLPTWAMDAGADVRSSSTSPSSGSAAIRPPTGCVRTARSTCTCPTTVASRRC